VASRWLLLNPPPKMIDRSTWDERNMDGHLRIIFSGIDSKEKKLLVVDTLRV
jgi:archaellum biogenesis ATPase FlaH